MSGKIYQTFSLKMRRLPLAPVFELLLSPKKRQSNLPCIASLCKACSLFQTFPFSFHKSPMHVSRIRNPCNWFFLLLSNLALAIHLFLSCFWLLKNLILSSTDTEATPAWKNVFIIYLGCLYLIVQTGQQRAYSLLNDGIILINSLVKIETKLAKQGEPEFYLW